MIKLIDLYENNLLLGKIIEDISFHTIYWYLEDLGSSNPSSWISKVLFIWPVNTNTSEALAMQGAWELTAMVLTCSYQIIPTLTSEELRRML